MADDLDTSNRFMVAIESDGRVLRILRPPGMNVLSRDDALNLAANLVALADDSEAHYEFAALLHAMENA